MLRRLTFGLVAGLLTFQLAIPAATGADDAPDAAYFFLLDVSGSMDLHPDRDEVPDDEADSRRVHVKDKLLPFLRDEVYSPGKRIEIYLSVFGKDLRPFKRDTNRRRWLASSRKNDNVQLEGKFLKLIVTERKDIEPLLSAVEEIYGTGCEDKLTLLYDAIDEGLAFYEAKKAKAPVTSSLRFMVLTDGNDSGKGKIKTWRELYAKHPGLEEGPDWYRFFRVGPGGVGKGLGRGLRQTKLVPSPIHLQSFAVAPRQTILVRFDQEEPDYSCQPSLQGLTGCSVSPETIRVTKTPQQLTFTGTHRTEAKTPILVLSKPDKPARTKDDYEFWQPPGVPLSIQKTAPPQLSFPGLMRKAPGQYSVSVTKGKELPITAETDVTCERIVWVWDTRRQEGQTVTFSSAAAKGEPVSVSVQALSKHKDPQGKPLETAATILITIDDGGVNFKPPTAPVWRDRPVRIEIEPYGTVESTWIEVEGTRHTDKTVIQHSFSKAGGHTVRAAAVVAGTDMVNTLPLAVFDPPVLRVAEPAEENHKAIAGDEILFAIADAEQFTDVKWQIDGTSPEGASVVFERDEPGTVTATVTAGSVKGGDRTFEAKRTVIFVKKPELVITSPTNYSYHDLSGPVRFTIGNPQEFEDGSIKWTFPDIPEPKVGADLSHQFTKTVGFTVECSGKHRSGVEVVARVNVEIVETAILEIVSPSAGEPVYIGDVVSFAVTNAHLFSHYQWRVGNVELAGSNPKRTFDEKAENVAVQVTAKARVGSKPASANATLTVLEPRVIIQQPQSNAVVGVGHTLKVQHTIKGRVDRVEWRFTDAQNKPVTPPGDAETGFIFHTMGDYLCHAVGLLEVKGKTIEVRDTRPFRVDPGTIWISVDPEGGSYPYNTNLVFRLEGDPTTLGNVRAVAWDFGDGKKQPAGKTLVTTPRVYNRSGRYRVTATVMMADGKVLPCVTDIALTARDPIAEPGAYVNDRRISELSIPRSEEEGWERVIELRNAARDQCDLSAETWTVRYEDGEEMRVTNALSFTIRGLGSYTFKYHCVGIPDKDGNKKEAEAEFVARSRIIADPGPFIVVCIICGILLALAFIFFLGNAPRVWVVYTKSPVESPVSVLHEVDETHTVIGWRATYVSDYWKRWKRKAKIPMPECCQGDRHWTGDVGSKDELTVTSSGLSFSRDLMMSGVPMHTEGHEGYSISDTRGGKTHRTALLLEAKERDGLAEYDERWLLLTVVVLATVVGIAWRLIMA